MSQAGKHDGVGEVARRRLKLRVQVRPRTPHMLTLVTCMPMRFLKETLRIAIGNCTKLECKSFCLDQGAKGAVCSPRCEGRDLHQQRLRSAAEQMLSCGSQVASRTFQDAEHRGGHVSGPLCCTQLSTSALESLTLRDVDCGHLTEAYGAKVMGKPGPGFCTGSMIAALHPGHGTDSSHNQQLTMDGAVANGWSDTSGHRKCLVTQRALSGSPALTIMVCICISTHAGACSGTAVDT